MGVEKTGDWEKVGNIISNLSKMAVESKNESLKNFGLKAEATAKTHISKQDLNWEALSEQYKETKRKKGLSANILVATSTYFQSITTFVVDNLVFTGVRKGVMTSDGKEELSKIASAHEFGLRGVKERQLWRPSLKETIAWHFRVNLPELILLNKIKKMK